VALKKSCKQLVAEAESRIKTIRVEEAKALHGREDTLFVDIRDVRELDREGTIPGALHAPRGMLEFWIDPESPYYKEVFGSGKTFVFFCALGWRAALATDTAQAMGLEPVCHFEGGFSAWKEAGYPTAERAKKEKPKKP